MATMTDPAGEEAPQADPTADVDPEAEAVANALTDAAEQRRWIASIRSLTETRHDEPFANSVVQIAYEDMLTAAFDRLERILKSDLPYSQPR